MEGEVDGMSDSREQSIPAESEERVVDIENNPETELSTTVSVEVSKTQIALKARKRTKTGCFTCRKRRIKCGEERPTCANCIKSKRSCEGYAPRLVFKDPLEAFRPGWAAKGSGTQYPTIPTQNGAAGQYRLPNPGTGSQSQLPAIAPRPLPQDTHNGLFNTHDSTYPAWSTSPYSTTSNGSPSATGILSSEVPPRMRQVYQRQENISYLPQTQVPIPISTDAHYTQPYTHGLHQQSPDHAMPDRRYSLSNSSQQLPQLSTSSVSGGGYSPTRIEHTPTSSISVTSNASPISHQDLLTRSSGQEVPVAFFDGATPPQMLHSDQFSTPSLTTSSNLESLVWTPKIEPTSNFHNSSAYVDPIIATSGFTPPSALSEDNYEYSKPWPKTPLGQLPVMTDYADDDYYDVESDDDDGSATAPYIASTPHNDLGLLLALSASQDDRVIRSYTAFLHQSNILSTYQPTFTASPLMDSTTARIFCHFITATGPSLSIFERRPMNPSVMFTGRPVPKSQQALWTYTLPMLALSNQSLLHAMLATASLHISKLQSTPPTSSLKHYHFALRRVGKAVATPSKRTHIATIAATLVLAHYEASTAEHSKWNSHLAGARQLLMEIDFKGMTKHIKDEKARRKARHGSWHDPYNSLTQHGQLLDLYASKEDAVDEGIVSAITGWKIRYDEFGRIVDDDQIDPHQPRITEKDIEDHHVYTDLFWFYCKLDVYQCLISGNRLLMPYDRWGHCPPRGPIARLDAIYGTVDHLVLLVGRVADFAAKDSVRKRKVVETNGGQWRPPPGMFPSPPPGSASGPPSAGMAQPMSGGPPMSAGGMPQPGQGPPSGMSNGSSKKPSPPPMYGMIPSQPLPKMPDGFTQGLKDNIYPPTSPDEDQNLAAATTAAEQEWHSIVAALDLFEACLGPDWSPLSPEQATPIATPFGPAIQYRTYSISCIWIMYYVGRIVSKRMHPSMPPAAMTAAAVASSQTAEWANTVGRIACGLPLPPPSQPLNPNLGGCLLESTLGLFFSGVQYTDPIQRSQTVLRLRTIADMSGFQSAALIAAGCETCWVKMAEAGRGPPYERTRNPRATDWREEGTRPPRGDDNDRAMVHVSAGSRVHWAMGIMSLDEDFRDLTVGGKR